MNYFNIYRCFLSSASYLFNASAYSCYANKFRYFYQVQSKCLRNLSLNVGNSNKMVLSKSVMIKNAIKSIGISEEKADSILKNNLNLLSCSPKILQEMISTLLTWGFTQDDIKDLIEDSPFLLDVDPTDLGEVLKYISEKVTNEHAVKCIKKTPELLVLNSEYIKLRTNQLLKAFANVDLLNLLEFTPMVFFENWDEILAKLKYIIYMMEIEQKEILSSFALGYRLEHIKARHKFLVYCGIYIVPTKRNLESKCPSLKEIVSGRDINFVKMCGVSFEEYKVFCKFLKAENDEVEEEDDDEADDN